MVSLLLLTHYRLAEAYRSLTHHFFGNEREFFTIVQCDGNEDPLTLQKKIGAAFSTLPNEVPVLVLVDICGATPCNLLNQVHEKREISVVTGLNAPMLVKAIQEANHYDSAKQLKEIVIERAKQGIVAYDIEANGA